MIETGSSRQQANSNVALLEKTVVVALFLLLAAGVLLVLRPFFVGLLFGVILAVAAWPVRSALIRRGLSSTVAAMVMLLALLAFVLVPLGSAAPGLAVDVKTLGERAVTWLSTSPDLPAWITGLPLVVIRSAINGAASSAAAMRRAMRSQPMQGPCGSSLPRRRRIGRKHAADRGLLAIATAFWARGEALAAALRDALDHLGGAGLANMTDVAGGAIRGVFYGVVGTAAVRAC